MRPAHHVTLLALAALATASFTLVAAQSPSPRIVAAPVPFTVSTNGEYLIQFTPRAAQRSQATEQLRDDGVSLEAIAPRLFVSLATMTPEEATLAAAEPGVVAIDPNAGLYAATTQPSPPWGLDRSDQTEPLLDSSFTYSDTAGAGITLYLIDSGINSAHDEFVGRIAAGYDDVQDGNGTNDCFGHGTHVAGIAAGTTYGFAKLATIVPVRVLQCDGRTSLASVLRGINWVIDNHTSGRAVATMSIGGDAGFITLDNAIAALVADGVAVAVAAGNGNGANACNTSPARSPTALTVGATTDRDAAASFSNIGPCLELFAPGSNIASAWTGSPTATAIRSGTSMAAPHVAGALAVLWSDHPALSAAQVQSLLLATAVQNRLTGIGTGSPNLLLHITPAILTLEGSADADWLAKRCAFSPVC